ncbi:MAG: permease [candidate division WOR-3 bacterium]|nr:permease [candidate division WOR-3 bacterium]
MIIQFLLVLKHYIIEILPALLFGFFLSGLVYEFVPTGWIKRYLGRRGIIPILYSTFAGMVLPICCVGSLPVAISFHKKGARLGPVLAFLVATPATSLTALLVTYRLLGVTFTVYIFFSVILMGVIIGSIGNLLKVRQKSKDETAVDPVCGMDVAKEGTAKIEYNGKSYYFCSSHCARVFADEPEKYFVAPDVSLWKINIIKIKEVFRYAFIEMPKEIGLELFIGLILASLIATVTPIGNFIGNWLSGGLGYLFALVFGLLMYICSTASVPLVHAFLSQGLNAGAGMVLLLAGPVTSWATILVLRKEFGIKTLLIYLTTISVIALFLGYCFSMT